MANWLERNVPRQYQKKVSTAIITALGLFLALQYNETIKEIFDKIYPVSGEGLGVRILYVLVLTVVIVLLIVQVEKALDGK